VVGTLTTAVRRIQSKTADTMATPKTTWTPPTIGAEELRTKVDIETSEIIRFG
jgi:hypothetical protein